MNPLVNAVTAITRWLENKGIPYMVFGGIANSIYGSPRQTFDIDIKLSLEPVERLVPFLDELGKISVVLPEKPVEFAEETNVVPVEIDRVRVDLVIAELPFEKEAIERSRDTDFYGTRIKVCLPEDLIIQKAVSTREKDWMDIQEIIANQRHNMDWSYLLKHCRELSAFLDDPAIYERIENWKNEEQV